MKDIHSKEKKINNNNIINVNIELTTSNSDSYFDSPLNSIQVDNIADSIPAFINIPQILVTDDIENKKDNQTPNAQTNKLCINRIKKKSRFNLLVSPPNHMFQTV